MTEKELKVNLTVNDVKVPTDDMVEFIRWNYKLLCSYRDDGRVPDQILLDDIKAYECILSPPTDAERQAKAREYADYKIASGERPRPRETARALGWMP